MDPQELLMTVAEAAGHSRHIHLSGELDLVTASALDTAVEKMVEEGIELVVLDLSDVSFIDSSGLRVIIGAGDRLEAVGGHLVIEGASRTVEKLLDLTGLINRYRRG